MVKHKTHSVPNISGHTKPCQLDFNLLEIELIIVWFVSLAIHFALA